MDEKQIPENQALIKRIYAAFNDRKINPIIQVMHPDVKWPKAWQGDYAHGHAEVRAYWERQWKEINPKVTPVAFRERENGTLEVGVQQLVKDLDGNILFDGKVKHVYLIRDGVIWRMDIELG